MLLFLWQMFWRSRDASHFEILAIFCWWSFRLVWRPCGMAQTQSNPHHPWTWDIQCSLKHMWWWLCDLCGVVCNPFRIRWLTDFLTRLTLINIIEMMSPHLIWWETEWLNDTISEFKILLVSFLFFPCFRKPNFIPYLFKKTYTFFFL